ncbi:WRKY transcription factor 71 [Linum grandiflorum]
MSDNHHLYYHHGGDAAYFPYDQPTTMTTVDDDVPPSSYYNNMTFTDCLHGSVDYTSLSKAFDLSPPPSDNNKNNNNSSGSFSSEEDSGSICNIANQKLTGKGSCSEAAGEDKKASATAAAEKKAKGEKRKKEARFAFMTKSEVDHLEDGYRWRKYGQKAVKNSPYPRSYYRCTTQKCGVKKRVERSFEDPSTVITTYEGQHNHPLPSTLRGNAAAMFSHSILTPSSSAAATFPAEFLLHMSGHNHHHHQASSAATSSAAAGSMYHQQQQQQQNFGQQQQQQYYGQHMSDYGLLQDVVPNSMFFKQEESS